MDESRTSRQIVRVKRLADEGNEDVQKDTTVAERIGMMWQLAVDAWAIRGESIAESRLPRHVVRLERRSS